MHVVLQNEKLYMHSSFHNGYKLPDTKLRIHLLHNIVIRTEYPRNRVSIRTIQTEYPYELCGHAARITIYVYSLQLIITIIQALVSVSCVFIFKLKQLPIYS